MPAVNRDEFGRFKPRHGHTTGKGKKTITSTTYKSWMKMKDRVLNRNHVAFKRYGGRGITICERWLTFENFLVDMGERPVNKSLERRNNNGNYDPTNCYWASPKQQSRNTVTNRLLVFHGLSLPVVEWAERFYIQPATILQRLKRGWSVERALIEQVSLSPKDHKNATGK